MKKLSEFVNEKLSDIEGKWILQRVCLQRTILEK